MSLHRHITCLLSLCWAVAGCTPFQKEPSSKPFVAPARMPPDSAALEVFFVRCPFDDLRLNRDLWRDADEQSFSAESRRLWIRNGFRVGIVAGQMSDTLAALLELKSQPALMPSGKKNAGAAVNKVGEENTVDLTADPKVVARRLSLRPGQRSDVLASGVYEEWPVLTCEAGQVSGQTYQQAQGLFAMRLNNERDGRVRLRLTPEIAHGQARQRWVGDQGVFRLEAGKPKRVLEDLTLEATLSPGQILLATSLPSRPGSLGHYFFTDRQSEKIEQKLLVVRLAQTQHSDILPLNDAPSQDGSTR